MTDDLNVLAVSNRTLLTCQVNGVEFGPIHCKQTKYNQRYSHANEIQYSHTKET